MDLNLTKQEADIIYIALNNRWLELYDNAQKANKEGNESLYMHFNQERYALDHLVVKLSNLTRANEDQV